MTATAKAKETKTETVCTSLELWRAVAAMRISLDPPRTNDAQWLAGYLSADAGRSAWSHGATPVEAVENVLREIGGQMNIESKMELLNTLASTGRGFPCDRIYRDGKYAIATNGWQVLAFRAADGEFDRLLTLDEGARRYSERARRESDAPEKIRRWLSQETETRTVDNRDLCSFLRVAEYRHCPYCKGSGIRPIEEPDLEDGLDDPFETMRAVDIGGAQIDCGLLLSTLAHLPLSPTLALATWPEVGCVTDGKYDGRILRLVGDGWTLIQMSVKREGNEAEVFPFDTMAATVKAAQ